MYRTMFECVGGFVIPVLPDNADGSPRLLDGARYFDAEAASKRLGVDVATVEEAYGVFLAEAMTMESPRAMSSLSALRQKYRTLSDEHFNQFLAECRCRSFDPFSRHVWAKTQWDSYADCLSLRIELSVDGFYALARRSGVLEKIVGPEWCGEDGRWCEVWTSKPPPAAARTTVKRTDHADPAVMVSHLSDNMDVLDDRADFRAMPIHMLGKRSACGAIRRAFPEFLHGIYAPEEMQAKRTAAPVASTPTFVPDTAPQSSDQFHLGLIDAGLGTLRGRNAVIEELKSRYLPLYTQNITGFYKAVLMEVRRNPQAYGAVVEVGA